jgi:UDP-GlcNAc:undecaprenyl-phosphate GlcNAc-1-phosphate transferase
MILDFIFLFCAGFLISLFSSFFLSKVGKKGFLEFFIKKGRVQDIHQKDILRIGGIIIFFSILAILFFYQDFPIKGEWLILILAGAILLIGGILDDIFDLNPLFQFIFQASAVLFFLFFSGIKIEFIYLPFIGQVYLGDFFGTFILFALLIFFINIFNFLDGVDGVASGIGIIGFLTIFILSVLFNVKQIPPAIFSLIISGSLLGFLLFNKPPAKVFLGTSGSNLIGFFLGALSIIAGSKVLTLLIVSVLPAIDAMIVIFQRFFQQKNIFHADQTHFHHILLGKGILQEKIFIIYIILTAFFAFGALFLQGTFKFIFFIFVAFITFLSVIKLRYF